MTKKSEQKKLRIAVIIGFAVIGIILIILNPLPYSEEVCDYENLSYNVKDFFIDYQNCLEEFIELSDTCQDNYEGAIEDYTGNCTKVGVCTKREISCSLIVNNLDNKIGIWEVDLRIYDTNDPYNTLFVSSPTYQIYPEDKQLFQIYYVTSDYGDARHEYSCTYSIPNVPTKEKSCEMITKYRW